MFGMGWRILQSHWLLIPVSSITLAVNTCGQQLQGPGSSTNTWRACMVPSGLQTICCTCKFAVRRIMGRTGWRYGWARGSSGWAGVWRGRVSAAAGTAKDMPLCTYQICRGSHPQKQSNVPLPWGGHWTATALLVWLHWQGVGLC